MKHTSIFFLGIKIADCLSRKKSGD